VNAAFVMLLVRHGESTWNVEGRYQGRRDPPLSELGEKQAHALAVHLATNAMPRAIVSSPLARARRTAELAARACGLDLAVDERLLEIQHGPWEGELTADVARRWPEMLRDWKTRPETVTFPDGESLADVRRRLESFLADRERFASPLLVVTHDVIVRLATLLATGRSPAHLHAVSGDNCAITEIHYEAGRARLARSNDTTHLGSLRADTGRQAL
jgi:phosphoserine phosphatase